MSLVWHIIKKDFRRLWAPLALWLLLLVAKNEIGVLALASNGANTDRLLYLNVGERTLLFLEVMVNMLLVAAFVHEDALTGARAFWTTRPISGGRLLVAKLLGAALVFGGLPLLASVRWWLVCGYDAAQMARATLALADTQAVTVGVAMLLASLTRNMNEFLGWLLALAVAAVGWGFGLALVFENTRTEITRGVQETRGIFCLALLPLGVIAVVVHQFFARQRRRSLIIAGGIAMLFGVVFATGLDLSRWWAHAPQTSPLGAGVTVSIGQVAIAQQSTIDYVLRNVPEEFGARVGVDHEWRWRDGTRAAARSGLTNASWPGMAEWRALGLASAASAPAYAASGPEGAGGRDGLVAQMKFLLWPEKAERLRREPATYLGQAEVEFWRPELAAELPLQDGAKQEHPGWSLRIDHAVWRDGEWLVTLVESRPQFRAYGKQQPSLATLFGDEGQIATGFALVNRARGEAVKLWATGGRSTLLMGTQQIQWLTLHCALPRDETAEQTDAPPRWLTGAKLGVIQYRAAARFDRVVTVEQFGAQTTIVAKP